MCPARWERRVVPGLDSTTVLGQNRRSRASGSRLRALPPNLNVFNNAYGIQQNLEPAAPGQGQQFDVPPGQENADVSRREWLGRYIDMHRAGMLKGGLLGQVPQEQLGAPLPGTAPPPGTNIPPGLVQFLPPPPEPAPPGDAAPPGRRCRRPWADAETAGISGRLWLVGGYGDRYGGSVGRRGS